MKIEGRILVMHDFPGTVLELENVDQPCLKSGRIPVGLVRISDQRHCHVRTDDLVNHRGLPDPLRVLEPFFVDRNGLGGCLEGVTILDDRVERVAGGQV